jgi:hypothetical protein
MQKSRILVSSLMVGMFLTTAFAQDRATRADKAQGVSFHVVSTTPATGYSQATLNGQTYFVAPKATIVSNQVSSVQSSATSLTLSGDFGAASKANQMGVLVDGQLVAVGSLVLQSGQATLTGLTAEQTQRVTHLLSRKSSPTTGALFTVVPAGQSNGEYTFDVFVQNVPNLRTIQVKLEVTGGTAGSLDMTDVRIDKTRPDYVFYGIEAIDAADHSGSRLGATLFNGTAAVTAPKYVGTWRYRPSTDAAGTFKIDVRANDTESFISNEENQNIPVSATGTTLQIGSRGRLSE